MYCACVYSSDFFVLTEKRYMFCKELLPAGTEFAVLDLMDDLEAGARAAREKDRAKAGKGLDEVSRRGAMKVLLLLC